MSERFEKRRPPPQDVDGGEQVMSSPPPLGFPPMVDSQFVSRMVESDIPSKVQERWLHIKTSKEFRLSRLTGKEIEQIKANDIIVEILDVMRRPPPGSFFAESAEGEGKYTITDAMVSQEMESYRIAQIARSRDGFEREKLTQSTQVLAHEGGSPQRPGFFRRVFGGFFGVGGGGR